MSAGKICFLLCASLGVASTASAQELFVTQLRLPARGLTHDTFACRQGEDILVDRASLLALAIIPPAQVQTDYVPLSAVAGLTYMEEPASAAIVITCAAACFATQRLGQPGPAPQLTQSPWGGYVNYDAAAQWVEDGEAAFGGVMEATVFGPAGRAETSWFADEGFTRLESRWTVDFPAQRLRLRLGDGALPAIGGGVTRFAGVQVGRHFGLAPTMITHPTPLPTGEAESASIVELYIDGALRARERVEAGPFVLEEAPFITGAGEAQLVITDALGRQQTIARPFFVNADMLRPGLSDWTLAIGAERHAYGVESFAYGATVVIGRYRLGVTNALTLDSAFQTGADARAEAGAVISAARFGQVRIARAQGADGGATQIAWFRDARTWSAGLQFERRDVGFDRREGGLRQSAAAHINLQLGGAGAISLTSAAAEFHDAPRARTLTLAYTPDWFEGAALRFRLAYTEREEADLAFGVSFSLALDGGVTNSYAIEIERDGASYRAGAQHAAPAYGGVGWRARSAGGAQDRLELGATYAGAWGESVAQAVRHNGDAAVRVAHMGAFGVVEGRIFAAAPVRGAFALIDIGAPSVGVTRDRLRVGRSGRDGLVLVANLRPYEANAIGIAVDELPFDRRLAVTEMRVTPGEGAGVVVRFAQVEQRLQETSVRFADGASPRRGAVLVRARDGARFPIGAEGRTTIFGAAAGDTLTLAEDAQCSAQASPELAENGLTLSCRGAA